MASNTNSGKASSDGASRDGAVQPAAGRIAEVFAEALIGAAGNEADSIVDELDNFVAEVLVKSPQFAELLASGMVAPEEKVAVLDRVFAGKLSKTLMSFLKVLVEHGRGDSIRGVQRAAHGLLDKLHKRVRVKVTTATPLDDAASRLIADSIRRAIGQEPMIERHVDPAVIGGAVYRIGDTVYDGSVATQLQRMRTQLLNRSVHEIQSGRDRFGNPEGN
jgi:F-type H+-transporting ATPase subunit delta